jgi:hypothetical protein
MDSRFGKLKNVVLGASGLYIEAMRRGPRSGKHGYVVSSDRRREVARTGTSQVEVLRAVGEVGTELKDRASVDQRVPIGFGHPARRIIPEPVLEVVYRLEERLDDVNRRISATGSSGIDGTYVIEATVYTRPLRLPTLAEHNPKPPNRSLLRVFRRLQGVIC